MLVASDTDDVFLPKPADLLVNLGESRAVLLCSSQLHPSKTWAPPSRNIPSPDARPFPPPYSYLLQPLQPRKQCRRLFLQSPFKSSSISAYLTTSGDVLPSLSVNNDSDDGLCSF
jgi:hypothetical protein